MPLTAEEMAKYLSVEMDEEVRGIAREAQSRARRAVNVMRSSALKVLAGERHGRVYKVPGTHGKRASRATRELKPEYGHNLRGGQLYRASAPGEAPAAPTGNLRTKWRQYVIGQPVLSGAGMRIICRLKSDMPYSDYLDEGTGRIKPRPYKQKIIDMSMPQINGIYENL